MPVDVVLRSPADALTVPFAVSLVTVANDVTVTAVSVTKKGNEFEVLPPSPTVIARVPAADNGTVAVSDVAVMDAVGTAFPSTYATEPGVKPTPLMVTSMVQEHCAADCGLNDV